MNNLISRSNKFCLPLAHLSMSIAVVAELFFRLAAVDMEHFNLAKRGEQRLMGVNWA